MPPRVLRATSQPSQTANSPTPSETDVHIEPLQPPPPFYNVSFSTHRASPLYIGKDALSPARLEQLASRLRDTLVGDVVRGVQVGLDGSDASLGRAGSLERVAIRWFDVPAMLGLEGTDDDDDDGGDARSRRKGSEGDTRSGGNVQADHKRTSGICIEMRYENALCVAILLPELGGDRGEPQNGGSGALQGPFKKGVASGMPGLLDAPGTREKDGEFLRLPLLLMRMPTSLKPFIVDFVSRTFDCRISPLRLGTKSLVQSWERWVDEAGLPSRGPLAKDVVLTLGFSVPREDSTDSTGDDNNNNHTAADTIGLRSLDVIIPAGDLEKFAREGGSSLEAAATGAKRKRLLQGWEDNPRKRNELAGGTSEEGWGWRSASEESASPGRSVIEALALYLNQHLALDLFHPGVRISRIACGGFGLAETRLKVSSLGAEVSGASEAVAAARGLLSTLAERAAVSA